MPFKSKTVFRAVLMPVFAIASSIPAFAQTQAQQDRLDLVAKYVVTAKLCERLGITLDPALPDKANAAFDAEAASWGIPAATVERLKGEAISRQGAILKTDLDAAANAAKTDAQLRNVRNILLGYGRTCLAATVDPIFSGLIVASPGYDLEKGATDLADSMLEAGGLASWQTPQIQARGDIMMLAGACRTKIGAVRSDALVREFGQSDDVRVRNYYTKSFDEGLAEPNFISTLAGCNRAIQSFRLKAASSNRAASQGGNK
jgi:hypothetical protein